MYALKFFVYTGGIKMIKNENTLMNFVKDLYKIDDLQYADFIKALVLVKFYPNDLLTCNYKLTYCIRTDKKNIEKIFHNINRIYYEISESGYQRLLS